ncbi:HMCN1-like protein, partial [Mya arenaria]
CILLFVASVEGFLVDGISTGYRQHQRSTVIGQLGVNGVDVTSHVGMELGHVSGRVTIPHLHTAGMTVQVPNMNKTFAHWTYVLVFFYVLLRIIDGWDNWSDWSSCSVTCGQGLQKRHRTCSDTLETMLGGGCIGNDQEQVECKMTSCYAILLFYAQSPKAYSISLGEKIVYSRERTNRSALEKSNTNICTSMKAVVEHRVGERVWVQGTSNSVLYEDAYYRVFSFSEMLTFNPYS